MNVEKREWHIFTTEGSDGGTEKRQKGQILLDFSEVSKPKGDRGIVGNNWRSGDIFHLNTGVQPNLMWSDEDLHH